MCVYTYTQTYIIYIVYRPYLQGKLATGNGDCLREGEP